jgi:hypothetical protein
MADRSVGSGAARTAGAPSRSPTLLPSSGRFRSGSLRHLVRKVTDVWSCHSASSWPLEPVELGEYHMPPNESSLSQVGDFGGVRAR